jgi:hypothetical protein
MSGGPACECPERKKPIKERAWHYVDYKCNYSKFSGSKYTPSNWSSVRCCCCGAYWRTKATWPIPQRSL